MEKVGVIIGRRVVYGKSYGGASQKVQNVGPRVAPAAEDFLLEEDPLETPQERAVRSSSGKPRKRKIRYGHL